MKMKDTSPEVDYWDKVVEAMISHQAAAKEQNRHSNKYPIVKADWSDKEMVDFVNELIKMHRETYINLFTWPLALSIVERYFDIEDAYKYLPHELERKENDDKR